MRLKLQELKEAINKEFEAADTISDFKQRVFSLLDQNYEVRTEIKIHVGTLCSFSLAPGEPFVSGEKVHEAVTNALKGLQFIPKDL